MGKQFDRLVCKYLMKYYVKSFEELKDLKAEKLVKELFDKFGELPNQSEIFDEINTLVEVNKQKEKESSKVDIEKKLDLIEKELNHKDIIVKMINGQVAFEEKMK